MSYDSCDMYVCTVSKVVTFLWNRQVEVGRDVISTGIASQTNERSLFARMYIYTYVRVEKTSKDRSTFYFFVFAAFVFVGVALGAGQA